jgi:hypothetical protein
MEAEMAHQTRAAILQWITPPIVVPALIAIAVVVIWLNN